MTNQDRQGLFSGSIIVGSAFKIVRFLVDLFSVAARQLAILISLSLKGSFSRRIFGHFWNNLCVYYQGSFLSGLREIISGCGIRDPKPAVKKSIFLKGIADFSEAIQPLSSLVSRSKTVFIYNDFSTAIRHSPLKAGGLVLFCTVATDLILRLVFNGGLTIFFLPGLSLLVFSAVCIFCDCDFAKVRKTSKVFFLLGAGLKERRF